MFELPENFYVRVTENNKDTLLKWLDNPNSNQYITVNHIVGVANHSAGGFRKGYNPAYVPKFEGPNGYDFGQEITFAEFKEYVLKETFILPDKWCIKNCLEVGEWFNKQMGEKCHSYETNFEEYLHSHNTLNGSIIHKTGNYTAFSYFRATSPGKFDKDFTEITLEQFRKYVANTFQEDYSYLIPIFKNLHIT